VRPGLRAEAADEYIDFPNSLRQKIHYERLADSQALLSGRGSAGRPGHDASRPPHERFDAFYHWPCSLLCGHGGSHSVLSASRQMKAGGAGIGSVQGEKYAAVGQHPIWPRDKWLFNSLRPTRHARRATRTLRPWCGTMQYIDENNFSIPWQRHTPGSTEHRGGRDGPASDEMWTIMRRHRHASRPESCKPYSFPV